MAEESSDTRMAALTYPLPTAALMRKMAQEWPGRRTVKDTLLEYERGIYEDFDDATHSSLERMYGRNKTEDAMRCTWRVPRLTSVLNRKQNPGILVDLYGNVIRIMWSSRREQERLDCMSYRVAKIMAKIRPCSASDALAECFDVRYVDLINRRLHACSTQPYAVESDAALHLAEDVVVYMNRYMAHVRTSQTVYEKTVKDGMLELNVHSLQTFKNVYPDAKVDGLTDTTSKTRLATTLWLEHSEHEYFVSTAFGERTDKRAFNLYRGLVYSRLNLDDVDASEALPLIRHIYEVWCDGNDEHLQYVVDWLAHLIQHPCTKTKVALVIRSRQGAGRRIIIEKLKAIFGTHFKRLRIEDVRGNFNPGLLDALVVFLDETVYSGDKVGANKLKSLITEPDHRIKDKFRRDVVVQNLSNVIVTTNDRWAMPVEEDCRRSFVLDCNDKYATGTPEHAAYFKGLADIDPRCLFKLLLGIDISHFNPAVIPVTAGQRQQKEITLETSAQWWLDVLRRKDGNLLGKEVEKTVVYDHYRRWMSANAPERRVEASNWFWMQLTEMVAHTTRRVGPRSARVHAVIFPEYDAAKARFCAYVESVSGYPYLFRDGTRQG
jgi:hypothetical protein